MPSEPELKIGILALQGAVSEHVEALRTALEQTGHRGQILLVKEPAKLEEVHGLIIPGGESTTIGRLSQILKLQDRLAQAAADGMAILGTCAGMVLMAKEVSDARLGDIGQPTLGLMDIRVVRNAFGRQRESFEAELEIPALGGSLFPGVFIRAPVVEKVWGAAEVLARYNGKVVAVQEGNMIATAFHPELADDTRLHQYLIKKILRSPLLS
ncbi:MAG: pyridoxal 5'-phosphate synthase glutaminase subunit PdxT [Candidatus Bathyarchaeia archaeon]